MSRPVITVYADVCANTWMARFEDDAEVMALFGGCDTVPTAYTLHTPGLDVRAGLQRRNPGHRVRLIDKDGTRPHPEDWPGFIPEPPGLYRPAPVLEL